METSNSNKRKQLFVRLGTAVGLLALIAFCLWFFYFRYYRSTDDAYVHGNQIQLNSQIQGTVVSICAKETDFVEKDQILVELDPTDYLLSLEKAKSTLAYNVRQVVHMFAVYNSLKAQLVETEKHYEKTKIDYENRVPLVSSGAIGMEEFQHVTLQLEATKAQLEKVYEQLLAQKALVGKTTIEEHPLVVQGKEMVREAWVNFQRTKIVAPTDGYVGPRKVQLGESVSPQTPLLSVVPLNEIWVHANFKETQLDKMRIGQKASIEADMYGRGVRFTGTVVGLLPGTGNAFSLLPPQNATGNWIKIVQRLPVRISLDPESVTKHPLMLGMSLNVRVDVSNVDGPVLSHKKETKPLYTTSVYRRQEEGAEEIIQGIIHDNIVNKDTH